MEREINNNKPEHKKSISCKSQPFKGLNEIVSGFYEDSKEPKVALGLLSNSC